jgi:hypothetical protein
VYENSALRKIFGSKKDLTRDWRKLRIVELLRSSLYGIRVIKSRRMRWEEHVACMGEKICAYRALVGKPEGKRTFGRTWCRGEANIKVDFGELVWEDVEWIDMVQARDR